MRIGIVTDIHDDCDALGRAMGVLREHRAETIVCLGDACERFVDDPRSARVVELLRGVEARCVWGNHDAGLGSVADESLRAHASPDVLAYLARMQPQIVLEGCRFSHVEPWLDPHRVEDLWYGKGPPETPELAARSFDAVPERFLFLGHFHTWLAVTPGGRLPWAGDRPLDLSREPRAMIVIGAVLNGACALFDTDSAVLTPIHHPIAPTA